MPYITAITTLNTKLSTLRREAKSMPVAVIMSDFKTGNIMAVNQHSMAMLGYESEHELLNKTIRDITHEAFLNELDIGYSIIKSEKGERSYQLIKRYVKACGSDFLGHLHAHTHFAYPDIVVGVIIDIDETRELTQATLESNNLDPLTGLLRREILIELMKKQTTDQQNLAVYFIDLNHFKPVNDSYGHSTGDAVLVNVANRLKAVMKDRGFVGRYGGDEFVVIANNISELDITPLAHELDNACLLPMKSFPDIEISACIGVASASGKVSAEDIIDQADNAMYGAKQSYMNGGSRIKVMSLPFATRQTQCQ